MSGGGVAISAIVLDLAFSNKMGAGVRVLPSPKRKSEENMYNYTLLLFAECTLMGLLGGSNSIPWP